MTDNNLLITGASVDYGRTHFIQTEQAAAGFDAARGLIGIDPIVETANDLNGRSKTWGLFATDTFNVTPKLALTASGRYNHTNVNLTDNQFLGGHKEATCIDDGTGVVFDCGGAGAS